MNVVKRGMLKSAIIWGSAGHAMVVRDMLEANGFRPVALFDNNPDVESIDPEVSLYHGEAGFYGWVEKTTDLDQISGFMAIGGGRGDVRLQIRKVFNQAGIATPNIAHPSTVISPNSEIGDGCQFLAFSNVAAGARVGNACILNHKASVDHESELGDGVHLAPGATLCGLVKVGNHSFIGSGATILPRVTIGQNCVVGAGAVVTRDVPDGVTVVGCPAGPIKNH